MTLDYEYRFSLELKDDCPTNVLGFFEELARGEAPGDLPECNRAEMEVEPEEVCRLITLREADGFACTVHLVAAPDPDTQTLVLWGLAPSEAFFMPFMALAEWLVRWSAVDGCVGSYHRRSLAHPTLVYTAGDKPYMLQVTGVPVDLVDGSPMPHAEVLDEESETHSEGEYDGSDPPSWEAETRSEP